MDLNVCRTCLAFDAAKDINKLPEDLEESKTCFDILYFCLNIEVTCNEKISTVLCEKCYSKVILFYHFKTLAVKNDKYLKSMCNLSKNEILKSNDIKCEEPCINNNSPVDFDFNIDVKEEIDKKGYTPEYHSDDEILSVLQKLKYEHEPEETKENYTALAERRKKRNKILKESEKAKQICDKCGKSVSNIKNHMNLHKPKPIKSKLIKCKLCDKIFSSHSAKYRHNKIKHLGIKEHCDVCNKDVVSLSTHRKVVHNPESLPFKCVICTRRFLNKTSLEEHNNTHTKHRPYKCEICDKGFRLKMVMLQHKRQVHDKEKSHLCQFCSKTFFKKYHLQVHLRSHSKEKPYKCNECGKAFISSSTLNNHKTIHRDERPFACNHCGMMFSRANYLRAHMVSHTRERKYPCKYCGVKFGRSDHRLRHQRTAHEQHLFSTT